MERAFCKTSLYCNIFITEGKKIRKSKNGYKKAIKIQKKNCANAII